MPKSSWSICVSGTIRVPTKRFCLPWFPRFDFFFHSTPSSPLENYSTTKLSDSPRTPSRSLRYRCPFFSFSLEKRKTRSSVIAIHSWRSIELLPRREPRVCPFNRAVRGKNRVRGSVTRSRFSKCIAVKSNHMGELLRRNGNAKIGNEREKRAYRSASLLTLTLLSLDSSLAQVHSSLIFDVFSPPLQYNHS